MKVLGQIVYAIASAWFRAYFEELRKYQSAYVEDDNEELEDLHDAWDDAINAVISDELYGSEARPGGVESYTPTHASEASTCISTCEPKK